MAKSKNYKFTVEIECKGEAFDTQEKRFAECTRLLQVIQEKLVGGGMYYLQPNPVKDINGNKCGNFQFTEIR